MIGITRERGIQMMNNAKQEDTYDLFELLVNYFNMSDYEIQEYAIACGYEIVEKIDV